VRQLSLGDRGEHVEQPAHRGVVDPQAVENHRADQDGGRHPPLRWIGNDHHRVRDGRRQQARRVPRPGQVHARSKVFRRASPRPSAAPRRERAARRTTPGTPVSAARPGHRIADLSPPGRRRPRALPAAARHRREMLVWPATFCARPGGVPPDGVISCGCLRGPRHLHWSVRADTTNPGRQNQRAQRPAGRRERRHGCMRYRRAV
jgi:hypothetical protein